MFIFLLKVEDARAAFAPFPGESLCPWDPSNQTSCCPYKMPSLPQLPGDVSWEDMRQQGRRRKRNKEGGDIFLHEWFINGTRKLIVFSAERGE